MATSPTLAPPPADAPDVLGSMSATERSHWRLTGELPSASSQDASAVSGDSSTETESSPEASPLSDDPAASSPAAPADPATSTDVPSPPASEPGTPPKRNADTRKAELAAEIQALLKQRDALRAEVQAGRPTAPVDVPPASSPGIQPVSLETVIARPDLSQPMINEETFYQTFPAATIDDRFRYVSRYEALRLQQEAEQVQSVRARERFYGSKAAQVNEQHPDVLSRLPEALRSAKPVELLDAHEAPGPWNYAVQEILLSPEAGTILAHLADHPEDVAKIAATRTPHETIRSIAHLEARLSSSSVPLSPGAVKTASSAPAPVHTVGKKPSAPVNDVQAAVAAQDFARYRSAMNAQERAR